MIVTIKEVWEYYRMTTLDDMHARIAQCKRNMYICIASFATYLHFSSQFQHDCDPLLRKIFVVLCKNTININIS